MNFEETYMCVWGGGGELILEVTAKYGCWCKQICVSNIHGNKASYVKKQKLEEESDHCSCFLPSYI